MVRLRGKSKWGVEVKGAGRSCRGGTGSVGQGAVGGKVRGQSNAMA